MTKLNIICGRFQPLTKAHLDIIRSIPDNEESIILTSATFNKNNPLCYEEKVEFIHEFTRTKVTEYINSNMVDTINHIIDNGCYSEVVWHCGPDRNIEYNEIINKYITNKNIIKVQLHEDISCVRATDARIAAKINDFVEFCRIVPLTDINNLYRYFTKIQDYYTANDKTSIGTDKKTRSTHNSTKVL